MRRRFAVLAVCTANICRSPLAELLLTQRLDRRFFEVASAGVRGWEDHPMDEHVQQEARRLGLDGSGFRSRPLIPAHVANADLVLTATREHRGAVLELDPGALRRTFTLREFAALGHEETASPDLPHLVRAVASRRSAGPADADVPDPYRADEDTHRQVADLIDQAVLDVSRHLGTIVTP